MIRISIFINTMKHYKIGASEAEWLLNAKVEHYKLLSNGTVIKPFQSL